MLDAIKPLLDSDLINEDTKQEIQEAWDSKLVEVRDQVTAELREEFAGKYEHDKSVMVEAVGRFSKAVLPKYDGEIFPCPNFPLPAFLVIFQ